MVYTGPSRACARCRQMKKKCDQRRPQCTRCIEARIQCYGYRDEFDIMYRDERERARSRAIAPKSSEVSSSKPPLPMVNRERSPAHRSPSGENEISAKTNALLTERNSAASSSKAQDMISFFFHEFCTPAKTCNWPGWMARLPEQYAAAPENACYRPALLAASYAILAKKQDDPSCQNTARVFYVSALEATSQALKRQCYDDSTMLAISLLDTFQFIMGECSIASTKDDNLSHGQHINGLKAVLAVHRRESGEVEHRCPLTQRTLLRRSIFEFMPQIQTLLAEIRMHKTPSEASVEWVTGFDQIYGGARMCTALLQFGQVSARSHELSKIVRQNIIAGRADFDAQLNSTELMSLIGISEAIDQNNELWHRVGNPKWIIVRKRNDFGLDAGGWPLQFVDCYHDLWVSCVWNNYRAARIVLMDTIVESAELLAAFNSDTTQVESLVSSAVRARAIIATMLDDIRISLPYACGQIDSEGNHQGNVESTALSGLCLLWPMNVLHSCKSMDLSDREWARDMLLDIGKRTGIGKAWALANRKIEIAETIMPPSTVGLD